MSFYSAIPLLDIYSGETCIQKINISMLIGTFLSSFFFFFFCNNKILDIAWGSTDRKMDFLSVGYSYKTMVLAKKMNNSGISTHITLDKSQKLDVYQEENIRLSLKLASMKKQTICYWRIHTHTHTHVYNNT